MPVCNEEAGKKQLKGDERKKFMSECPSSKKQHPAASDRTPPARGSALLGVPAGG